MLTTDSLLAGAIDTHVHTAPDVAERAMDDFQLAEAMRGLGMAGAVLKNHLIPTPARAQLVNARVEGFTLYGAIVLNRSQGGMNPWAVEAAARCGAKVVWMPTAHAAHQTEFRKRPGTPPHAGELHLGDLDPTVHVFDADGALLPETRQVLEVVRDRQVVLATGHLPPRDVGRLLRAAQDMGIRRVVATHPDAPMVGMTVDQQRELAERGLFFERTINILYPPSEAVTPAELAGIVRAVGPASTICATDAGRTSYPTPPACMQRWVALLLEHGFRADEIRAMVRDHAQGLLEG